MPEWVKVSERLPDEGAMVWLCVGVGGPAYGQVCIGTYLDDRWWYYHGHRALVHRVYGVTHWMPVDVPEPPEEGEP